MTELKNSPLPTDTLAPRVLDPRDLILALHKIQRLPVAEIPWDQFAELVRQLCRARHSAVIRQEAATGTNALLGRASDDPDWTPLQLQPVGINILERATERGYMHAPVTAPDGQSWLVAAITLSGLPGHTLVLHIPSLERGQINELILRALLCDNFSVSQSAPRASISADLSDALDLASQVMRHERFDTACLTLANGLAAKWTLIQAAVGWMQGDSLRIQAISHLDRFERNASQTIALEKALQATQVSAHPLWWEKPSNDGQASSLHVLAGAANQVSAQAALAIPIPDAEGVVHGVVWAAFEDANQVPASEALQLGLDLLQPRLADLHEKSLPLWMRAWHKTQGLAERLFGPEHSLLKASMALGTIALLYIAFGTWPYRIEASAQLNTEATRLISAQFDGRIEQVMATAGDLVKADALLVALDTKELEQQHAELQAEISRFQAELSKNQAEGRLAESEIAQAKLEQSEAKERRVFGYLQQAQSRAPFEGVIVEGERKDLIGAPVRKGDKIFKIAKVEGLFVTLMVAERNMRSVEAGAKGEVSLLSHADYSIPIRITSVIPVAQVKGQEGNQFMITATLLQEPQAWWRPGMTGVARIDAGERNIAWILTHRLLDNVRLLLWW